MGTGAVRGREVVDVDRFRDLTGADGARAREEESAAKEAERSTTVASGAPAAVAKAVIAPRANQTTLAALTPVVPTIASPLKLKPPTDAQYQIQSASAKQEALWREISGTPYDALPDLNSAGLGGGTTALGKLKSLAGLFNLKKLNTTFDKTGDVRPAAWKLFHPFGAAAKVKFEAVPGTPYGGLFKSGAPGILRLSLATPKDAGFVPGAALKLFVDGKPSENMQAIHSLEAEKDENFFGPSLSNQIAPPKAPVAKFAAWVTHFVANPLVRPVDNLALGGKAPKVLEFRPSADVANASTGKEDFRKELGALPAGTTLYDVYARASEKDEPVLIGHVSLDSQFVASKFEDQSLFFKHAR